MCAHETQTEVPSNLDLRVIFCADQLAALHSV